MMASVNCWMAVGAMGLVGLVAFKHLGAAEAHSLPTPPAVSCHLSIDQLEPHIFVPRLTRTSARLDWSTQPAASSISPSHSSSGLAPTAAASSSAPATPTPAGTTWIRVEVASQGKFEIGASTPAAVVNAQNQAVLSLDPGQSYPVSITDQGIQIGDQVLPNGIWIEPGADGLVWVGGHWYRGWLQIGFDGQNLLAINWVELNQYLYSVVGSEMPQNWNIEALKAQAVAARSYALVHLNHPASDWFDLGNDERWQAYRGVEAESDSTQAAVDQTSRQVLVGPDGQILESLYAATERLTQLAHRGIGMSQYGSQQLAAGGQPYQTILLHYYPSAEIAELEDSHDEHS